jgi:hypothetical protein
VIEQALVVRTRRCLSSGDCRVCHVPVVLVLCGSWRMASQKCMYVYVCHRLTVYFLLSVGVIKKIGLGVVKKHNTNVGS